MAGSLAKSLESLALSSASLSPRLLASSLSSSLMFFRLHSSHCLSNCADAFSLSGIHTMRHIPYSFEPSELVIANPCQVDLGRPSAETTLISLGKANMGTYSGKCDRRFNSFTMFLGGYLSMRTGS